LPKKKTKNANGEGTIVHRGDGRWMASITVGRNEDGTLKRRSFYGKTRRKVSDKVTTARSEILAGTYIEPSKLTVGQWLDAWLKEYVAPSVRPPTYRQYESMARVHIKPALGRVRLQQLQGVQVQQVMNDLAAIRAARTVEIMRTVLHAALKQAEINGLVIRNVAEHTKKPKKQRKPVRVLTNEEQQTLLSVAEGDRLGPLITFLLYTGLRRGEAVALKWENVDLAAKTLRVVCSANRERVPGTKRTVLIVHEPKTESGRRSVPLPPPRRPSSRSGRLGRKQNASWPDRSGRTQASSSLPTWAGCSTRKA
jgi:integrase